MTPRPQLEFPTDAGHAALAPARTRVVRDRVALATCGVLAERRGDDAWWSLAVPVATPQASAWERLALASALPASVRCLADGAGLPWLAIDAPAGAGERFTAWTASAAAALDRALAIARGDAPGELALGDEAGALPAELATGLDWAVTARGDGTLGVDLGVAGAPEQAQVRAARAGAVTVAVTLGHWRDASATAREALAWLVLLAAGSTRLVRPFANIHDDTLAVGFERHLDAPVEAADLDHALHAIAAVVERCAAEAAVVAHEEVARAYLARRPGAGSPAPHVKPRPGRSTR